MKAKIKAAVLIAIPVLLALTGAFFLFRELDARQIPPLLLEADAPTEREAATPTAPATAPVLQAEPPTQETAESHVARSHTEPNTIIIRGKAYPLKTNIEESTLKTYIGWMDTSAKPGQIGVCVVMGHRNKQLRCLKDVVRGDVITIIDGDGAVHAYTVESGKIIEDNNITFAATDRPTLALITCYPFYYSGSAPHQYVVTAVS